MQDLKAQDAKQKVAKLMAAGYSIPESDALGMLGDAHSTNYAENREFFLNQNNPTNFERTWNTAYFLYKKIGAVTRADAVRPGDGLLGHPEARQRSRSTPSQKNEYDVQFAPASAGDDPGREGRDPHQDGRDPLLPELVGPRTRRSRATVDGKDVEELYDPNVGFVVEEIGKLAGQYGAARIVIEGHTDGSMRGQVPKSLVQELSLNRANSVKEAHRRASSRRCSRTSSRPPGIGWDRPADDSDPDNAAKNRRVEIKVYPAEAAPARSR